MGTISLDGLVSGLDTTSIINAYVQASGASRKALESRKSQIEEKKSLWQTFNGYLGSLKARIESIAEASDLKKMKVSSSDSDLITAEVTGTALAGTYSLEVSQLANSETTISTTSFADGSTAFSGDGNVSIVQDGVTTNLTLTTNTLDGAISAINDANIGVSAYKIQQADGTYVIGLTSTETGADQAFTITASGVSFSEEVEAQDTLATVNGVSVKSSTRTLADVLPGVTLSVIDETTSAVTVTVTTDTSAIKDEINGFIDDYNTVMGFINNQVKYSDTLDKSGPLSGDSTLRNMQATLQSLIRADYTANAIDNLAKLGIETNSDGTLSVDDTDLTENLDDSLSQVIDFFTSSTGLFSAFTNEADQGKLDLFLDSDGTVQTKLDSLDNQIEVFTDSIEREEKRLEKFEATLRTKFSKMEALLSTLKATQSYVVALANSNNKS